MEVSFTLGLQLSLAKCADVQVGGPNSDIKGISGGERKRVSLALEVSNFTGWP